MAPGVADRILGMLRGVEPFKSILDKLLQNTGPADQAASGEALPPPPPQAVPTAADPTIAALRGQ